MNSKSKEEPGNSRSFEWTTRRPVAISMAVAAIAVFGWVSYDRLPLNLMPDISYLSLMVRTDAPGMAPEEVENLISRPIEQALGVVRKPGGHQLRLKGRALGRCPGVRVGLRRWTRPSRRFEKSSIGFICRN